VLYLCVPELRYVTYSGLLVHSPVLTGPRLVALLIGVKAVVGLGTLALSDGVWADPQRRLSVQ
jgi:hypothetical protein